MFLMSPETNGLSTQASKQNEMNSQQQSDQMGKSMLLGDMGVNQTLV